MNNERKMTYQFWYDHWKNHNFASSEDSTIGPITWDELVKKFGFNMIVDATIEGIIRVVNDFEETHITEFPPHVDPANNEKSLYRIHFEGEDFVKDLRYQIIMDLNDEDLKALHKKYPTEDTFGCDSDQECEDGTKTLDKIMLSTFKYWFEHWSGVDYGDDLFDEQTMEELAEEYGMENMKYALKQGWLNFYYGGGVLDDIAGFECPEDETGIVEMHFDAENMARASKMLMDDTAYVGQLEDCNDMWGYPLDDGETGEDGDSSDEELAPPATIKRKREQEDETPQKKAKCDSPKYRSQSPMQAFLEEQNESDFFTKENDMQKGDEIVTEVVSGDHVIQLVKLAYPRVIATTADGNIMENEDGSIVFPNGVTYHSEVTSVYSDSSMPGGVIDDNGCIKKDAPNLADDSASDEEDMIAENKATENCQENHTVGCTKC